jgi:hypothetical protein
MRTFLARLRRRSVAAPQVEVSPPPDPRPASGIEELLEDVTAQVVARFDPAKHTVAEVNAWIAEHPFDRQRVIRAERRGKARKGILGN